MMPTNHVKRSVNNGQVSLGTFMFEFQSSGVARLAASAGAEFAVYDMEHTGWTIETIRQLIATTRRETLIPYVRIPASDYHFVARVLDVGAMGIMVPMVETPEQAKQYAAAAKYPPMGRRGAAFGVAHDDYSSGDIVDKIAHANEETHLIAQIETALGLENIDAIAAIDGIDVLWIGHFDLSNSLGIPGQFDHPEFIAAMDRVLAACEKYGKVPGFMAGNVEHGRELLQRGFRMIAYGGDLWLYQQALQSGITTLRSEISS